MTIRVAAGAMRAMRAHPGGIILQVQGAGDAEAVGRALNRAGADLTKLNINYVTQALPAATGPFIWVDAKSVHPDRLGSIPDIVSRHLAKEGVTEGVIAVPKSGGPLLQYPDGLDQRGRHDGGASSRGDSGVPTRVKPQRGGPRDMAARPVTAVVVAGDLRSRLRGASGRFLRPRPLHLIGCWWTRGRRRRPHRSHGRSGRGGSSRRARRRLRLPQRGTDLRPV